MAGDEQMTTPAEPEPAPPTSADYAGAIGGADFGDADNPVLQEVDDWTQAQDDNASLASSEWEPFHHQAPEHYQSVS